MRAGVGSQERPVTPVPGLEAGRQQRGWPGYLIMPVLLGLVCLGLYLYVSAQELDAIEARKLNAGVIGAAVWRHVELTAVSTVFTLIIAVPLGVIFTRPFTRHVRSTIIAVLMLGLAVPTIAILVLLALAFTFVGFQAAIVGLVLYAIIPVLLNTMVGLEQVDPAVLEAGRGMGMSRLGVLWRLEMPLAVPVILAGVRIALVINVGWAIFVTYINAGGLGDIIIGAESSRVLEVGVVLVVVLALLIGYLASVAGDLLRPKGL